MNGPTPPSTTTATATFSGMTRAGTAARHATLIAIQPTPCAQPSSSVSPSVSALTSRPA
jgi:hypothetical protein